jgi:hypothetical protein
MPSEKKMPSTAPSEAPEDAPRISGETSGLRNRPWNAVPATASAAPNQHRRHARAAAHLPDHGLDRGRDVCRLAGELGCQDREEIANGTAKRPAVNASSSPATGPGMRSGGRVRWSEPSAIYSIMIRLN